MSDALAPGFTTEPYWREAAPLPVLPVAPLPDSADVAIVGSGFTGLSAALGLARAGRSVVVLEAGDPGQGASTRNAGVIGRTLKHGFGAILEAEGAARARAVYGAARAAFDHVVDLVERERIDCAVQRTGRFMGANSPGQYEAMARELELKRKHLGDEYEMVPRAEQHREVATDAFHGGGVIPDHRMLHPGLLHAGLLARVREAGAAIVARTAVTGLRREAGGFELQTARGRLRSREAIVATNGYTGPATPSLRRRVIPLNAFMAATETLPAGTLRRLVPNGRTFHDYTIDADYGRPSPDGARLLFGGLTGTPPRDLPGIGRRLHARLARLLPDLAGARLTHVWTGACAATFDLYPHIGDREGVRFALGYCFGSGMPLGTWLGDKLARRILGQPDAATPFDDLPLETRFFHWGPPWFVPLALRYYAWVDRGGF